ncbi:DUF11 domain-containing protein [Parasphingorhabdus sp.]|uniref:DUF11 domain-containing protein n=1 Tax=Parasphingorhabdus sp. TaxID=2709688 RepID=UPI0035947B1B
MLYPVDEAEAQTVNQYTISEPGGPNDIVAARTCGAGGSPLVKNFSVGTNFIVSDVDLGFLASHSYRTDINVILQSPAGTRVTAIVGATVGGNSNLNVHLSDESSPMVNSGGHGNDSITPTPTPYQRQLAPNNPLSAFDGENAAGTWRMEICDMFPSADNGNFLRADLWLTELPANFADLSLSKTFGATGSNTGIYTLSVTNASESTLTATGVTVSDNLPAGVTLTGISGTGSFSGGIWTLGTAIAPGQTISIELSVTITATSGIITNIAQIRSSSALDPDSTPNNGVTSEDDYASVSFTAGGRLPGYVPPLTSVCSLGNQIIFSWAAPTTWSPSGSLGQTYTVPGLGNVAFAVTQPPSGFTNGTPAITTDNSGGGPAGTQALYFYMNNGNETHVSSTTFTLPVAVPGLQFKIFDIDFAANQFTDKVTVTGTYNGATVLPTLSNNTANYVSGNSVIGDGASGPTEPFGNVVVTFTSPVDSVTVVYGNHFPTTPTSSGNQAMSIHDITFCRPSTSLSVTKVSSIISDPVNGSSNPKRIPGAVVQYCILISNTGASAANSVVATDILSGPFTYTAGSMRSGSNCGSAATVEDDDATGTDESDPYGASRAGSTITATATTLAAASGFALTFRVTVD